MTLENSWLFQGYVNQILLLHKFDLFYLLVYEEKRFVVVRKPFLMVYVVSVDDAEEKAGPLHHCYPCLASTTKPVEFNHDTLMHELGNIIRENVEQQIIPFKTIRYISPWKRSSGWYERYIKILG